MADVLGANPGKQLEAKTTEGLYLRLPVKTRLIKPGDGLMELLDEYVAPHLQKGDILFVSEKIVCICQNRIVNTNEVQTSWLARILSKQVKNYAGTPQFRGLGHGTAPAMQLVIDEAGYPRVFLAAVAATLTRPLGIHGIFYALIGKMAKSVDCPMSWTIEEYKNKAKRAPADPDGVAKKIQERLGCETVIVDANYRGAFSLGKSSNISERFVREALADNPAGQDSEMTPFLIIRRATV